MSTLNLSNLSKDFEVIEIEHNKYYIVRHKETNLKLPLVGDYTEQELGKVMALIHRNKRQSQQWFDDLL